MGIGFVVDSKWVFPIYSHLLSNSSTRQYSSSLRGREAFFESARVSTLSIIPEESEILYRDPLKAYACSFGALQSIVNSSAEMEAMMLVDEKSYPNSHSKLNDINMPILEDTTACLGKLPANNGSHFSFLIENIEKLEQIFFDTDLVRLERDILIQIGRLGALKLFHQCLTRTLKEPNAFVSTYPLTEFSKDCPVDTPVEETMVNITVCSGKKWKRKSRRERALEKDAKISSLLSSSKTIRKVRRPTVPIATGLDWSTKLSNPKSRRLVIARNESEMSKGVKDVGNLEKLRCSLEEKIGRAASISRWAEAAGMDEKELQQHLHFGWYCRDQLLKSTHSLVVYLARNYRGLGICFDDLLQAGNMGVLQGAERFDPLRGYRFSTYVQYWIRKSMSTFVARHSRGIQIPVTLNRVIIQTQKARRALYNRHGRYPQDDEIAMFTGLSLANVRLTSKFPRAVGSIDQKVGHGLSIKFTV
eukprot:TRINITY_DN9348_c0_g1_i2.p1 TRINITY_DN9348_c0_g1~~TRINITY_DN9348_c0_g1_i2.p1  ORF type:complete len:474 (+),score=68.56 TRINITY_DN9348_c0_g1_i2:129-1550(+)